MLRAASTRRVTNNSDKAAKGLMLSEIRKKLLRGRKLKRQKHAVHHQEQSHHRIRSVAS